MFVFFLAFLAPRRRGFQVLNISLPILLKFANCVSVDLAGNWFLYVYGSFILERNLWDDVLYCLVGRQWPGGPSDCI